jgi:hypothetical protein
VGKNAPSFFRRKIRTDHGHKEYDDRQKEEHLDGVIDKKIDRLTEMSLRFETHQVENKIISKSFQHNMLRPKN